MIFITLFLPIALIGWYCLKNIRFPQIGKLFLVGMSLWFYGYYNPRYLAILVVSLVVNFLCSILLEYCQTQRGRKWVLGLGILANVGLLFYFKYFNFFLDNCNFLFHTDISVERIALPLGISFFTFQQLSFILDRYYHKAPAYGFWDYACFITYFPQLIAGPIVLHNEFIPQLQESKEQKFDAYYFFDGLALFILGLGKKVLIADVLAIVVNAEYHSIAYLDAPAAWITIICYMLELYFDFSGYCDMARGVGKMFGFYLPENFDSPLMAVSVKDFWRRWHMTLSRFLTTYIYIPLGGNRKGLGMKCRNLMIVFLVSGLWHGANWTYVVWGGLHGIAMVWEALFPKARFKWPPINRLITGVFVTLTFSIFRSESLEQAWLLLQKLFGGGNTGFVWGLCNTLQIAETYIVREVLEMWRPQWLNLFYAACMILLLLISLLLVGGEKAESWIEKRGRSRKGIVLLAIIFVWAFISLSQVTTFLYFDF